MKHIVIAATAALAILTIAGLTGTTAARAQITKAVHTIEHPAELRDLMPAFPDRLCTLRAGAQDMLVTGDGRPVDDPRAILAQNC